jgi:hypothetical protein
MVPLERVAPGQLLVVNPYLAGKGTAARHAAEYGVLARGLLLVEVVRTATPAGGGSTRTCVVRRLAGLDGGPACAPLKEIARGREAGCFYLPLEEIGRSVRTVADQAEAEVLDATWREAARGILTAAGMARDIEAAFRRGQWSEGASGGQGTCPLDPGNEGRAGA